MPPAMAVQLAAWRSNMAERELAEAVLSKQAREQRLSWHDVGEAIGTTADATRQRYSRV